MKKLTFILLSFITINIYSQDAVDIGTPANSILNSGTDIQGTIQNSVNEVTGKVTFSVPLGSVATSSVSSDVGLTYNGQAALKNGQQTNKYNPTSIVGVGWSMAVPKIVVDNKSTGTRDDDEFFLLDGATSTKLICIDRGTTVYGSAWKFQMEKYAPWIIEYHYSDYASGDYWTITKENGLIYIFGNPVNTDAKDTVIRYGNWIGSSKQSGATTMQTIQWNIYKIQDQWNNNLVFEYDKVNQTMSGYSQTEASYLKKITSSNGANIQLTYGSKNIDEYYEPHQEASEPDAYQERYEKKFLQSVSTYNNENELVSTYNLAYTLNGTGLSKKRYLTSLTQTIYNNGQNEVLPAQIFDYHYTGTFKGGIKTITYPAGGSVTYNYNNKFLFNNYANLYETTAFTQPSGFNYFSSYVSDNYGLYVYKSVNATNGKYQFKFFRVWWNGMKWEWHEFTFPHLIAHENIAGQVLQKFQAVLEKDFYGFVYDKGTSADIYLFHLNSDGRTWYYKTYTNTINHPNPSFLSGNGFVALGTYHTGQLYTYTWNGSSWNTKTIYQGEGEYFYGATNNYIVVLDEKLNGNGVDMITGVNHDDHYYIHYLDAERNWQTKSWSAAADPYISNTQSPSYLYPDNAMLGIMIDYNPELFFRWDTNYNLTNVDNVLGSYVDTNPMQPVNSSMFTIYNSFYKNTIKTARFNGINWNVSTLPSSSTYYAKLNFGNDIMFFQNHPSIYGIGYHRYNPNTNTWSYNSLNSSYPTYLQNYKLSITNKDFTIASNKIYEITSLGTFNQIGSITNDNNFTYTDGLSYAFIKEHNTSSGAFSKGSFFYINKSTGLLENINLGLKYYLSGSSKIGGYTPFMSPNAIWLRDNENSSSFNRYFHRIIDDKLNNAVYDIVVDNIQMDDYNGNVRKIQYTYNNPKCAPDNSSTFYGEVITENKGFGTGNIGKVVKIYNDGAIDLAMVGLPLEVQVYDSSNTLLKKSTTTWTKYPKWYSNGSHTFYDSYFLRATSEQEEMYFGGLPKIATTTSNAYGTNGLKISSTTTDSQGKTLQQNITYAYQQYTFVNGKNMLSFPYQVTSKIGPDVINVEQSKWIDDNGKAYNNENWSGPTTSNLRLNSQISKVESTTGNVLENNNGKGLYNSVLFGYDNLYEVATISNATYLEVVNQLDVTYAQLQTLSTAALKTELLKLYDRLPNASISLSFYDSNGRVTCTINNRKEEAFVYYDTAGRQDYITDAQGNVLEKKEYNFAN